jgi:SagB-type dehydrogenase family enzyme
LVASRSFGARKGLAEVPARLRRASTILAYWDEGRLVVENYRTRVGVRTNPLTIQLLDLLGRWRRPRELASRLCPYTPESVRAAIRQLLEQTLLVREGTPEARQDAAFEKTWSDWLPYGCFHFSTKDVPFVRLGQATRLLRRYLAESPPPPASKRYPSAPRFRLPSPGPAQGEFLRVLLARKTHREFSRHALPLPAVSQLLYYTWGVTGSVHSPVFGRLPHKTSPSGGARHPIEVYLVALRVRNLSAGLYHYDPQHHRLEHLRRGSMRKKVAAYCAGQTFVQHAAALFLMTAVFPRSMWKYRGARAYRVVLLDAGHLCQTFCLVATWLGLAPFCTAALKDSLIETELGLDGVSESVLYVAGVGWPRTPGATASSSRSLSFASL